MKQTAEMCGTDYKGMQIITFVSFKSERFFSTLQ